MPWFKHGWGPDFSPLYDPTQRYHLDFSGVEPTDENLLLISARVIQEIKENYPPPYYLMVSGGIDIQLMLWCWKNSGVEFQPLSFRYKHNDTYFNNHDLESLKQFSKFIDTKINYVDIEIIDFLESNKLQEYASAYKCTSPQICTHMYMSEQKYDGTVIFSGNFVSNFTYTNTQLGILRYEYLSGRPTIPFFFMHDPVLASKFMFLEKHPDPNIAKFLTYSKEGAPLIPQQEKYTGFEKIKEYYDQQATRVSPEDRLRFSNMPSKRVFDLLFRYKLIDYVKYDDVIVKLGIKTTAQYRAEYDKKQREILARKAEVNINQPTQNDVNTVITEEAHTIDLPNNEKFDNTAFDIDNNKSKDGIIETTLFDSSPWG